VSGALRALPFLGASDLHAHAAQSVWCSPLPVTDGDAWLPSLFLLSVPASFLLSVPASRVPTHLSCAPQCLPIWAATAARRDCIQSPTYGCPCAGAPDQDLDRCSRCGSTSRGMCGGCRMCAATALHGLTPVVDRGRLLPGLRDRPDPAPLAGRLRARPTVPAESPTSASDIFSSKR